MASITIAAIGRRAAERDLDPSVMEIVMMDEGIVSGDDVFLVAAGTSDGHVAFNPAGTAVDSRTRIVDLAETTQRDDLRAFSTFGSADEVPRHGVSVGLGTIARVVVDAHGFDPVWPATVVWACRGRATVLLDSEAQRAAPAAADTGAAPEDAAPEDAAPEDAAPEDAPGGAAR